MYTSSVTVSNDYLIAAYQELLRHSPAIVLRAVNRTVNRNADDLSRYLRRYPGAPRYPLVWTSERQRRYVLAKLRRENNLPYRRTGRLAAGYKVIVVYTPATITMIEVRHDSPVPHVYVKGLKQQKMHTYTGWDRDSETIEFYSELMADEVETDLIHTYEVVEML